MKTLLALLALAFASLTATAQTNGVTLTPDQVAKLDNSINSVLPLIPAQYQGAVASAIAILGILAMLGRVLIGWRNGGLFGAMAGLFGGTNTPAANIQGATGNPQPASSDVLVKGATLLKSPLVILAIVLGLCLTASAQTTTTNAVPNFINQTYDWVTSVNTNYDWTNVTYQADSGYKNTVSGAPAAFVSGTRNFGAFSVGAELQVLASSATIQQAELRTAYAFYRNHDLKIEGALYAGYDCQTSAAIIEPEIRATKLLTVNTYTFLSYSLPWETSGKFNPVGQVRSGIGIGF